MKFTRYSRLATAMVAGALILTACGGDNNTTTPRPAAATAARASCRAASRSDGSSTVAPLTTAAAELFKEEQPGVNVTVGTSGTGGGFEKFCAGETDISDASRPIKEDEEAPICDEKGIEYAEIPVANDALTVVVSTENDFVDCLTTEQLKAIWEPGSKVNSWKDVDPSFPDEKLELFGPGTDSGTFDYFTDVINGEEGASREDYSPSEDDNVIVQGVSGSKGGLGYFGFTYFEENSDSLKALEIDSGDGLRRAERRDGPRRHLHPAVPAAVHLPVQGCAGEAPGQGVPRLLPRERRRHRGGGPVHPAQRRAEGRHAVGLRRLRRVTMASTSPTKAVTAAGTSLRRSRPRYGERLIEVLLFAAALVSIATTIGIIFAVAIPTEEFFRSVSFTEFFTGTELDAAVRQPVVRRAAARVGHDHHHADRDGGGDPAGSGCRDLPQRVRRPEDPTGRQADARGPRRRTDRGVRVLRPQGHHAAAAGHLAGRSGTRRLQRPGRRVRHGHHDHPDDRLAVRGRHVRGAAAACATAPTHWAAPRCSSRPRSSSRPRCPASSRPSCSACPGRSARP